MNKFDAFKQAYDECPSQDNEGYSPDRGAFKVGFLRAWEWRDLEHEANEREIKKLRERNEALIRRVAKAYTLAKKIMGPNSYVLFSQMMDDVKEKVI